MATATTARPVPPPPGAPAKRRKKRREWPYRLSVTLLILASICVTLFPIAGTYYNNWRTAQAANRGIYAQTQTHDNERWLAMARKYNASLPPGAISDPWTGTDPTKSPQYKEYLHQLSASDMMARLRIPKIKVILPVRHGTSDQTLDQGGGHMYGTSLPVGGPGTNVGIAAHRGLPTMTAFDQLPDLQIGDEFFIDVYGEVLAYKVTRILTVLPSNTKPLARTPGKDQVTLITCTPYGINSHRLLVTGDRIPLSEANPADANWHQSFDWAIQPWMHERLAIAAVALLLLLGLFIKWALDDRKRRRRRKALLARRAAEQQAAAEQEAAEARAQAAAAAACTCGAWEAATGQAHEHGAADASQHVMRHAADEGADRGGATAAGPAQGAERVGDAEDLHRPDGVADGDVRPDLGDSDGGDAGRS